MLRRLLIASVALLSVAACTKPGAAPKGDAAESGRRSQDANKDGKVTLEEARAAQKRMFDRFDTNHDGKLAFEEIEAMPERLAGRMDRMDKNGDREISGDELAGAADDRFRRRDKNGDGVLTGDEARSGRDRAPGSRASTPL